MSRAIKLTRIHAINWYGYNDSLPVDGNLLLAGVTGSGKSIIMDLLMTVLVGTDNAHRHFNRSATGAQSDRTLKSYCLLDTKREENGVPQYLRPAAITYIALEFVWPAKENEEPRVETWGLRIEFRNTAENQGHIRPFVCSSLLTKKDFLDEQNRPLELPEFKRLIEKTHRGQLFETQEQYLRDMAGEQHLNFNRGVLNSLLPQAMSFTNLKSFDEFCRQFILPDDKLNVTDVVASYKNFLAYERDLKQLLDQQQRLENICKLSKEHDEAKRDQTVARWLSAELSLQDAVAEVARQEKKLAALKTASAEEEARIAQLDALIAGHRTLIKSEEVAFKAIAGGDLYLELQNQKKQLVRESNRLREIGTVVDSTLRNRVKKARQWVEEVRALPFADAVNTKSLESAIKRVEGCAIAQTEQSLQELATEANEVKGSLRRAVSPFESRLRDVQEQKGRLNEEITLLRNGQLPFPTMVLNALNQELPKSKTSPQPLCQLCEVTDEDWRAAVEVAFTRKFAIVVSEADYPAALKIYRELKSESPQESLIHPGKALRLSRACKRGSLAEKIRTEHPVAKAIINHLFGDLMCVENSEDLARHDFAIMKDGFMSRGAFVERRRHYDGLPFVGQRGLERQLAIKRKQLAEVEAEERSLLPQINLVHGVMNKLSDYIPAYSSLMGDLREAQRLPEVETQVTHLLERLNSIDRASFEEKERKIAILNEELSCFEKEQRMLFDNRKKSGISAVELELEKAVQRKAGAERAFERVKSELGDISVYAARMKSWRKEITEAFPALDAAAREFDRLDHEADNAVVTKWANLKTARYELALGYPKYQELSSDDPSNAPWAKLLKQIADANVPEYQSKSQAERKRWEQLFRSNVLQRMDHALRNVNDTIALLNHLLKQPIGNDRYEIKREHNPDYRLYRQLIDLNAQFQDDGLFYQAVQGPLQDTLTHFLQVLTSEQDANEAANLLDYRRYFDYDLLVSDARDAQSKPMSVDKQSGKMSGGENQSPYFIAILASYLRAYKRHERRWNDPSLALVPIDEAFSKMDTTRIKNCIEAIAGLDLQGAFSMSTGNVPGAFSLCKELIIVSRQEHRRGSKIQIRNVPVAIRRDSEEGRQWMETHAP